MRDSTEPRISGMNHVKEDSLVPGGRLLSFAPSELSPAAPDPLRAASDFQSLTRISAIIRENERLAHLEDQFIEAVLDILTAERAAVLLVGDTPEEIISVFGADRRPENEPAPGISRWLIDQALQRGVALLAMPGGEDTGGGAESLWEEEGISSALVTPLIAFQRVRGVLYADTSRSDRRFSVEDLGLLNLIGCALAVALDSARQQEILSAENRRLLEEINIQHDMVGESPRMREVFRMISKIAAAETTVIIRGESGTGKELAARAIHANSSRAPKPFVAINCAALTETLLESELFGHEKGSFTGAIAQKKGKIELAQGGTLFLDEVGEMALTLQAKLLRVLQEREFERVGGIKTIQADIRLITATNRNLEEEVRAGMFRQDLYYRLNVVSLNMPALRERREDIPLLANFFVRRYSERCKRGVKGIAPEARVCLMHYDWPGNVRELENAVERAVVLGSTDLLLPEDLPEAVLEVGEPEPGAIPRYHEAVLALKKQLIVRAFEQAGGSYTEAARALGVHPNYLHRLIRNMNLKLELTQRSGK